MNDDLLRNMEKALVDQVKAMRNAQKAYFRTRSQTDLNIAKDAERRVDALIDSILHPPQKGLFS